VSLRTAHIVGAALFFAFTALQFNDAAQYDNNDAWIWIALYGGMGFICVLQLRQLPAPHWLFAWAGLCWGSLLFRLQDSHGNLHIEWLSPANFWNAEGFMVQHANESSGLFILAFWASAVALLALKYEKANSGTR